jgi:26S proteasome regulatory subunit T1
LKKNEEDIQSILKRVNELAGIKESDTGLAPPALWDLAADKQILSCKCNFGVNKLEKELLIG